MTSFEVERDQSPDLDPRRSCRFRFLAAQGWKLGQPTAELRPVKSLETDAPVSYLFSGLQNNLVKLGQYKENNLEGREVRNLLGYIAQDTSLLQWYTSRSITMWEIPHSTVFCELSGLDKVCLFQLSELRRDVDRFPKITTLAASTQGPDVGQDVPTNNDDKHETRIDHILKGFVQWSAALDTLIFKLLESQKGK